MDIDQVRLYIIRPALDRCHLWSQSAENLVLGTGLVESGLNFVDQLSKGPGPAYGLFQMELATYEDIWKNYLSVRPQLAEKLRSFSGTGPASYPPITELWGNNFLAAAMCRVHYARVSEPLPKPLDAAEMARYWKQYYNTPKGKGSVTSALQHFTKACEHHG